MDQGNNPLHHSESRGVAATSNISQFIWADVLCIVYLMSIELSVTSEQATTKAYNTLNTDTQCLLCSGASHLSQPRLVTLGQQLTGLLVHLQGLFLEHTQAKALDILFQLGNGVHGLEVAHGALLAQPPARQREPGLQEGQSYPRAPETPPS